MRRTIDHMLCLLLSIRPQSMLGGVIEQGLGRLTLRIRPRAATAWDFSLDLGFLTFILGPWIFFCTIVQNLVVLRLNHQASTKYNFVQNKFYLIIRIIRE